MVKKNDAQLRWADDLLLVKRAAQDDRSARRTIAVRLLDRVRATVRYVGGQDRDYEDLVQNAMVEILRSAGSFQGHSSLETWADKITMRSTMRHIKRRRNTERIVLPDTDSLDLRPDESSPREHKFFVRERLTKLFAGLPVERRAVLALRFVYGYSLAEISDITETSQHTVRDRLYVGRKQLREKIRRDPAFKDWVALRES